MRTRIGLQILICCVYIEQLQDLKGWIMSRIDAELLVH